MKKPLKETAAVPPPPAMEQAPRMSDATLKRFFLLSIIAMMLITWISGFNVGYHQDEIDMNNYGKANFAYYTSGGKDTSFMGSDQKGAKIDHLLKYYGSAFEYLAVGANKLIGQINGPQEFNTRHAINQVFAILAILFTGLIARRIGGWRAALIAAWLLFLTPTFFGLALFNTKDIPFCAGYIASLYFMIIFLQELPTPGWKNTICLMLAFAFTTNTRIGGLLLIFYLFLFMAIYIATNKEILKGVQLHARSLALHITAICAGGLALVVLTWPFLLRSPVTNLIATMNVVKKFPMNVKVNFEGVVLDSLHLPVYYLPKFILITVPLFIIAAFLLGFICFIAYRRQLDARLGLLLLTASIFPVVYALYSHVALYSGWRHFLFIYPGICIIAAAGLSYVAQALKKPALQIGFGILCLAGMIKPVIWSINNHPYEYTYFNEWGGGFKKAFYEYETDYWEITLKHEVDWLMSHEPIMQSKDSVSIVSNASVFVQYYIRAHYPKAKVRVGNSGFTERNSVFWRYAIFHPIFLEPNYLENCYPPPKTIHSEGIDGIPIAVVLRDTDRMEYRGIATLMMGNYLGADSFLKIYFKTEDVNNIANVGIYPYLSTIKAYEFQNDLALQLSNKCFDYYLPPNLMYFAYCGQAIADANKGKFSDALKSCNQAIHMAPDQPLAKDLLKQITRFSDLKQIPTQTNP